MNEKANKRAGAVIAVSVAATLGGALAILAVGQVASATPPPIALLTTGDDVADAVAVDVDLSSVGEGGLTGPLVSLASNEYGSFWAGTDKAGNICLVTNPYNTDLYSIGCATPEVVKAGGLWISSEGGELAPKQFYLESYLLPDDAGIGKTDLRASGLVQIAPNVLVGDSRGKAPVVESATGFDLQTAGEALGR
ncbi:hypothetical protein [Microbacterium schleiferi]|uniref:Uncharacterized protein n=1 Tax=Microbacterium schleiferi TaxID=69362 RepID=A0ABU7V7F8_9MICO